MGVRERRLRSSDFDLLLSDLFLNSGATGQSMAIAAVGSYGRGELAPGSDLDIVILHGGIDTSQLNSQVNAILYPLWDQHLKIDHSVRSISDLRKAIDEDLKVAMGLLDIRFIAGDVELVASAQALSLSMWRESSSKFLTLLEESLSDRQKKFGELAYLLEPDLKESRGGLRDITALRAMNLSGKFSIDIDRISSAEEKLSDVRESLHLTSGRAKDHLLFAEQDKVASALGYVDADALMREVSHASRTIDYLMKMAWNSYFQRINSRRYLLGNVVKSEKLAPGIILQRNEVLLDTSQDWSSDPFIVLRAAAIASQRGVHISLDSLKLFGDGLRSGDIQIPALWPEGVSEYLFTFLGAGEAMIENFESLDQEGILYHFFPEWSPLQSLPQRNFLHRHTVDRHMIETAAAAATLIREVHRPDILLFSSLFHDIGKGSEEDHSQRGEILIAPIALRVGFNQRDVALIQLLIRHHLLLAATATRRDLDDPLTIRSIVEVIPDLGTLELLHSLTIADGQATGRSAWSDWKASLVRELVKRVSIALRDNTVMPQPDLSPELISRAEKGALDVKIEDDGTHLAIEIVLQDRTGLLSIISGIFHLLRCEVRSAKTKTINGVAVMEWLVELNSFAPKLTEEILIHEIEEALSSRVKLTQRVVKRIEEYRRPSRFSFPQPIVESLHGVATDATVLEIRSHDRPALLFTIGDAISRCNIDIRSAIVTTLGAEAIDTLYVTEIGGGPLNQERVNEVTSQLSLALK